MRAVLPILVLLVGCSKPTTLGWDALPDPAPVQEKPKAMVPAAPEEYTKAAADAKKSGREVVVLLTLVHCKCGRSTLAVVPALDRLGEFALVDAAHDAAFADWLTKAEVYPVLLIGDAGKREWRVRVDGTQGILDFAAGRK